MIKVKKSKDGQWYWVLVAKNGKVLHQSETMKQKASVFKNIEATGKIWKEINKTVGIVGVIES